MLIRQCRFVDGESNVLGGLYVFTNGQSEDKENDYIICGCCGGVFRLEDVESYSIYPNWVDISNEIIGE